MVTNSFLLVEFDSLGQRLPELPSKIEIGYEGAGRMSTLRLVERPDRGLVVDPFGQTVLGASGLSVLGSPEGPIPPPGEIFSLLVRAYRPGRVSEFLINAMFNHDLEAQLVFGPGAVQELCLVMGRHKDAHFVGTILCTDRRTQSRRVDPAIAAAQKTQEDTIDESMLGKDLADQIAPRGQNATVQTQHAQPSQSPPSQQSQTNPGQSSQPGQNAQQTGAP